MFKRLRGVSLLYCMVAILIGLTTTHTMADDKKVYRLKLAETWGPNFPIFGDATKSLAKLTKEMSNGRLLIRIDSANKHKAALGIFDMVRAGQYDMGHSASYYWKGKDINTLFFTTMPFGMTALEQYSWFYHGGGMALMEKVYAKHGLLSFPGGNTGNQMGGWFQKEINSVDDLKGLKMRIPGFAGEVLAKLGAKPTNIPPGELYTALERGTIDALEWVGPSLDLRMGFQKVAPYYYTGWHEPATELQYMINKKSWDKLPADLQAILKTAMRVTAYDMLIHSYHESAKNLASMLEDHPDLKVLHFPEEVIRALEVATNDLIAEMAGKDPMAKEILDSLAAYEEISRQWTGISDNAYVNNVSPDIVEGLREIGQ